jgi:outer membrane putative beta-barrel porin/alpha-amylase
VILNQFTTFITYGLSDRVDISTAIPLVTTSISVRSEATIKRLGSTNPAVHFYRQADGSFGDRRLFTSSGRASGLGDITVRAKSMVTRWRTSALGVGVDLRIPTGNEKNLLGAGAAGLKPFAIWSGIYGAMSPHANLGYLWNGSSTLAGSPLTGDTHSLPDQVSSAIGIDLRLSGRLTTAFDVLGDYVIDSPRLVSDTFARNGVSLPNITFTSSSFAEWDGAAGMKVLLTRGLLLYANLLFKLNDTGLRSRTTALIGLGFSM